MSQNEGVVLINGGGGRCTSWVIFNKRDKMRGRGALLISRETLSEYNRKAQSFQTREYVEVLFKKKRKSCYLVYCMLVLREL